MLLFATDKNKLSDFMSRVEETLDCSYKAKSSFYNFDFVTTTPKNRSCHSNEVSPTLRSSKFKNSNKRPQENSNKDSDKQPLLSQETLGKETEAMTTMEEGEHVKSLFYTKHSR